MKLPVKLIAVLVMISLIGVFAYQAYWLTGLYHTMKSNIQKDILESIQMSDYSEMMVRIDSLSKYGTTHGVIEASAELANDTTSSSDLSTQVRVKSNSSAKDSAGNQVGREQEVLLTADDPYSTVIKQTNDLVILSRHFQRGIHSGIDDFACMNLQRYDSILTEILKQKGIIVPHRSEVIHYVNIYRNDTLVKDTVVAGTVINPAGYLPTGKAVCFDYAFNIHGNRIHRLWIEPVETLVLKQMTGILITSFLIFIILSFSFGYLIHILLRLKTLDEMKEDFTHNMTHELKTPIAVAYAANDALLNFNTEDKDKRRKYQYIIQEQLKQLGGLVEQILSMSMEQRKNFRLRKENVRIKELVSELIERHTLKADKPTEIRMKVEPADLTVNADRTHLYNILGNLVDNAVKYSTSYAHVSVNACKTKEQIRISVTDEGVGIPSDKLPYIFDKFYRIPSGNIHNVKGYGLGLYYVKLMAEQHGGKITVESVPGKGSTFTLQLPL